MPKKTVALMSQKSPIYKYAQKKGIKDHDEHDVLLDILKAGKNGRTLQNLKQSVKEFANELPRILPSLERKGVIVNQGNKYVGIYAAVKEKEIDSVLYRALAEVLNFGSR